MNALKFDPRYFAVCVGMSAAALVGSHAHAQ